MCVEVFRPAISINLLATTRILNDTVSSVNDTILQNETLSIINEIK